MKNYYQILGVNRHSNIQEIKRNYRKLATKFHPDKNNGDTFFEEMFKEILEAYEVLSDNLKRARYDNQYDRIFVNKKRDNKKKQTDTKENKSDYDEKVKSEKQHSYNQYNIKKKKKKNYNNFFIGLIIIGLLKFVFWIKKETYDNKNVIPEIVNTQKVNSESGNFVYKSDLEIDKDEHLKENDYIYFINDNFKITSDYKFEFSEEASKEANELSIFPINFYTYYYYDDNTNQSITEYSIQAMDIKSFYKSSPALEEKGITKKYFNSVKLNISSVDDNYMETVKNDVKSVDYSYMAGTVDIQIPAKGIFFVKNKKAYIISVVSKINLNLKMKEFKKAFEFIEK